MAEERCNEIRKSDFAGPGHDIFISFQERVLGVPASFFLTIIREGLFRGCYGIKSAN